MKRVALAALAALSVSACATPYEAGSFNKLFGEGVTSSRLDATTLVVTSKANEYTSHDTVLQYALRKSAEETLAAGYEWFVVVNVQDRTRTSSMVMPTQSYTNANVTAAGNTAYGTAHTTTFGGGVATSTLPGISLIVRMGRGPKPEGKVFDANETLSYLVPATQAH